MRARCESARSLAPRTEPSTRDAESCEYGLCIDSVSGTGTLVCLEQNRIEFDAIFVGHVVVLSDMRDKLQLCPFGKICGFVYDNPTLSNTCS